MSGIVRLDVTHTTVARYSARVEVAYHCAHLTPRNDARQQVLDFELAIDPPPAQCSHSRDAFGNVRTEFALFASHDALTVRAQSRVALTARAHPVDAAASVLGAKAFGASKWAIIGSGVGLVVGLFLGLPGILLGPAVGAIAFEYARNPDFERALRSGVGAFVGFLVGSVLKVTLAFVLVGVVLLRLLVG
jgi:uncharacterized protein YqgC (DUF456 family)